MPLTPKDARYIFMARTAKGGRTGLALDVRPVMTYITVIRFNSKKHIIMATYYRGTEIKFTINATAEGFSMDDDDFEVEVATGRNSSVKGFKDATKTPETDVVVFKESDAWKAIVNTSKLSKGAMRVIVTVKIPDANANDGIRSEIAVDSQHLGELVEP